MKRIVERKEDMSPRGKLVLLEEGNGDIVLEIIPDPNDFPHRKNRVEFCTYFPGGSRSPRTHKALSDLMDAMERDSNDIALNPTQQRSR